MRGPGQVSHSPVPLETVESLVAYLSPRQRVP